jgi:hypothetical protein
MMARGHNVDLPVMTKEIEALVSDDNFEDLENLGESEEDLLGLSAEDAYAATVAASDWTAETLLRQIDRGNIDLNPEFQRREAWTTTKQSRYIESLIVGLPVPQIVLAERQGRKGKFLVLDGKQRLLSMQKFMTNNLKLTGLDLRPELNRLKFDQLDEDDRNALENQTLRTVTVRNWKSEDFLYLVFLRLNTASVPLSPQELRTALHPGPFVDFANEFTARTPTFAQLFRKNATIDFRMRDIELLIRSFAFADHLEGYDGSLKHLLDSTTQALNKNMLDSAASIEAQAVDIVAAIETTQSVFGANAFRLWLDDQSRFETRFNRAIYDSMVYVAAQSTDVRSFMESSPSAVVEAFKVACASERYKAAVTSTTKTREAVQIRLNLWVSAIAELSGLKLKTVSFAGDSLAYAKI